MRKWSSNSATVLESLPQASSTAVNIQLPDERDTVKALSIRWVPDRDVFTLKVDLHTDGPNTKQQLFQHCWLYDLNWQDPLPPIVEEQWIEMKRTLRQLERIEIP